MTIIKGDFGKQKAKGGKTQEEKKPPPIFQFHVSLSFSEPLIWRRICVPGDLNLLQFHQVLQLCMGWSGEHNHQFYVGKVFYSSSPTSGSEKSYVEADYTLESLEESIRWCFTYMYDAGDGWEHELVLEEILPAKSEKNVAHIIDGEWACPPEEIGNVHSYQDYINAIENPDDDRSRTIVKQYSLVDFDPYLFDMKRINEELRTYRFKP